MAKKQSGTISKRMAKRAEQRRKKRQTQIAIVIAVLVILAGVAWAVIGNGSPDQAAAPTQESVAQDELPRVITVSTANEMVQGGAYLLDVRTPAEWDDYHIPGATLIPLDELESRVNEVPRDQDVVVVCRSGNRSQVGRDILLQAGITQVTSMDGGVNAWRSAGFPIE